MRSEKIINFGQFCNKKYYFFLPFNTEMCGANPACMCLTNLMWNIFSFSFDQMKPDSSHSFDSAADLSISHPKLWQNKFQFFSSRICWGQDLVRLALLSPKETIQQCAGHNFPLYKYRPVQIPTQIQVQTHTQIFIWFGKHCHPRRPFNNVAGQKFLLYQVESIYKKPGNY